MRTVGGRLASPALTLCGCIGRFSQIDKIPFDRDDLVVTCAAGHLVQLAAPEPITRLTPVIPESFDLVVRETAPERLNAVLKQIRHSDGCTDQGVRVMWGFVTAMVWFVVSRRSLMRICRRCRLGAQWQLS